MFVIFILSLTSLVWTTSQRTHKHKRLPVTFRFPNDTKKSDFRFWYVKGPYHKMWTNFIKESK